MSALALGYPLLGPSRHVRAYTTINMNTACGSPALTFSATIHFTMKRSAPCAAVLCHSLSSWTAVIHWSALIPKARMSSRRRPIYSFPCPLTQSTPPTSSPNIKHFGGLVSSMRATNSANRIRLLLIIASMLSLPIFVSVSR